MIYKFNSRLFGFYAEYGGCFYFAAVRFHPFGILYYGVVPHEIQNKRGYAEGDRFLSAGEPRLCVRA